MFTTNGINADSVILIIYDNIFSFGDSLKQLNFNHYFLFVQLLIGGLMIEKKLVFQINNVNYLSIYQIGA